MVATVIRFPEEEYNLYKEIARERGESLAEFFRKSARKNIGRRTKKSPKYSFFNIGRSVVFKGGPKDGSVNMDKYYYEWEEKRLSKYAKKKKK